MIHKFVTDIIGCSRVCVEINLVNAFRKFLNASLERRVTTALNQIFFTADTSITRRNGRHCSN